MSEIGHLDDVAAPTRGTTHAKGRRIADKAHKLQSLAGPRTGGTGYILRLVPVDWYPRPARAPVSLKARMTGA